MNRNFDPMIFLVYKNAEKGMNQRKWSGGEGGVAYKHIINGIRQMFYKKRKVKI